MHHKKMIHSSTEMFRLSPSKSSIRTFDEYQPNSGSRSQSQIHLVFNWDMKVFDLSSVNKEVSRKPIFYLSFYCDVLRTKLHRFANKSESSDLSCRSEKI